ncbi:unnamed protein product [Rotaria sp. Silwood1]|nr:unnamed protein product [Rotaria sp. Silwood1]CAF0749763.1 unnamed protein product [Rotaria sp. Silwood1]CAF3329507.1 unnamed protein product [Rotaria sp. Silwood1]CAF4635050.1 unnamed protein product [Rotaria sp. Silwood1]
MATHSNSYDDKDDFLKYIINEAKAGYMETRCRDYLDVRTYRHAICFDTGEYFDALELYAPVGSLTIQKIIDDHHDLDTIHLRRPAPVILPIIISKICNDPNSYVIPSGALNIHAILPRSPRYQLEAIICELNQHCVIFVKNLETDKWYYYQDGYTCEQFSSDLNDNLNNIIESRSVNEQIRLIESAHFLISLIFHNAVKYVYRQEEK